MCSRRSVRAVRAALATALAVTIAGSAGAQTPAAPNSGALTFTGGVDLLPKAPYFLRGLRQETDPKITLWPYGDIRLALSSGDGVFKSVSINFGVWNSLQTGSSGTAGPSGRLHYEEDFYATLNLGFVNGLACGTTFNVYTSPNGMFDTVKEISVKISRAQPLSPYGIVAFEIGGDLTGQADIGQFFGGKKGIYLELGAAPNWPLAGGKATFAVPVKLGVSLKDYYENPDGSGDSMFGFFDVGGLVTVPLSGVPSQFGSWNVHGGADVFVLGDTTEAFNVDKDGNAKNHTVIGLLGIGLTY